MSYNRVMVNVSMGYHTGHDEIEVPVHQVSSAYIRELLAEGDPNELHYVDSRTAFTRNNYRPFGERTPTLRALQRQNRRFERRLMAQLRRRGDA